MKDFYMNPERLANEYVSITETPELAARIKKAWLNGYYEYQNERTKLIAIRSDDQKLIASLQKQLDEATTMLNDSIRRQEETNQDLSNAEDLIHVLQKQIKGMENTLALYAKNE